MPKKAYINLFDNAHKCLRGEVMSPEKGQYAVCDFKQDKDNLLITLSKSGKKSCR